MVKSQTFFDEKWSKVNKVEEICEKHLKVNILDKLADVRLNRRDCQGLWANATQLHGAKPASLSWWWWWWWWCHHHDYDDDNHDDDEDDDDDDDDDDDANHQYDNDDDLTVSSSFGGRVVCFPFKASILCSNSSTWPIMIITINSDQSLSWLVLTPMMIMIKFDLRKGALYVTMSHVSMQPVFCFRQLTNKCNNDHMSECTHGPILISS